jgi:hypothetical protein
MSRPSSPSAERFARALSPIIPTFPDSGWLWARIVPSSVLGNGKSRTRAQQAVDPAVDYAESLKRADLPASGRTSAVIVCRIISQRRHAGSGGARSRVISDRISTNICRDTATSAIWKVT